MTFLSSSLTTRQNKLEFLYLAIFELVRPQLITVEHLALPRPTVNSNKNLTCQDKHPSLFIFSHSFIKLDRFKAIRKFLSLLSLAP
jgi:hypothetical protein